MKPSAMALITSAGGSAEIIERHSEKWNTRGGSGSAAAIEANQESIDIFPQTRIPFLLRESERN